MLSFIASVLKPCFKYLNNTKLNSLSKAIACVALGLRGSHLVDIAHLDLNQAKSLLLKLKKKPSCRSLVLVQFKDRFTFICHKQRLLEHLNWTLSKESSLVYIAVEGKEPVKSDVPPMQLIAWLQIKLLPFLLSQESIFYSVILPTCMVSITGWALEYPVIYTTHLISDDPEDELDEWEQRTNCLGGIQPLQLIQLWLSDHMLLSFSYPLLTSVTLDTTELELKVNHRLDDLTKKPDWLNNIRCEIRRKQIKLDRFAL